MSNILASHVLDCIRDHMRLHVGFCRWSDDVGGLWWVVSARCNDGQRWVSLVSSMGRIATHTGYEIFFRETLECKYEFAPGVAELTNESAAPLMPYADGRYPVPRPGIVTEREH